MYELEVKTLVNSLFLKRKKPVNARKCVVIRELAERKTEKDVTFSCIYRHLPSQKMRVFNGEFW